MSRTRSAMQEKKNNHGRMASVPCSRVETKVPLQILGCSVEWDRPNPPHPDHPDDSDHQDLVLVPDRLPDLTLEV